VFELLAYQPPECPLDPAVDGITERGGIVTELVSWPSLRTGRRHSSFGRRVNGRLPASSPCTITVHSSTTEGKARRDGRRACDHERVQAGHVRGRLLGQRARSRGFVVVVPDNSSGIEKDRSRVVPEEFVRNVVREAPGTGVTSRRTTSSARLRDPGAKTLFASGTTWTGIMPARTGGPLTTS